jgi:hypothetical protein
MDSIKLCGGEKVYTQKKDKKICASFLQRKKEKERV